WLLERMYHAQLRNGRDLSVSSLTEAMKQLTDCYVPLSSQSWKSRLPQRLPLKKSSNGSQIQTVFPQFSYYHELECPSGIYRLEFFGPRMAEQGYKVEEESSA